MVGVGVGCYQRDRRLLVIAWEWKGRGATAGWCVRVVCRCVGVCLNASGRAVQAEWVGERICGTHTRAGLLIAQLLLAATAPPPTTPFKHRCASALLLANLKHSLRVYALKLIQYCIILSVFLSDRILLNVCSCLQMFFFVEPMS